MMGDARIPRGTPRPPQDPPMGKRLLERPKTAPNAVAGPRGPKKMKGGGAMNTKMSTKGGMKGGGMTTKGYAKGGMKDLSGDGKITQKDVLMGRGVNLKAGGGMMTTKGGMKGGGMATKGNTKGGAKKRTSKAKVRGAGIARKGVRPVKMR